MATLAQLQAEPWYGREFAPPSIVALGKAVRAHFGLAATDIGTKGDVAHLRGYHRSRAWVKNSAYCTNRSYSIKETAGNREGGSDDWVCALDISAPSAVLLPMCQRLDSAVRAGKLEKVTEWYGNIDGDKVVDGWNNIADRVASSDSSHLWHLHISFDRGRAGEDHADLLAVLTGKDDDMTPEQAKMLTDVAKAVDTMNGRLFAIAQGTPTVEWAGSYASAKGEPNAVQGALAALTAKVEGLALGGVDADALVAKLVPALVADPGFKALLVESSFEGAQQAEKE